VNPPSSPTVIDTVEGCSSLLLLAERDWSAWLSAQPAAVQNHVQRNGFMPESGRWLALPEAANQPHAVIVGTGKGMDEPQQWLWLAAGLADRLPPGDYALAQEQGDARDTLFATGWSLGGYRFDRYRSSAITATAAAAAALPRLRRPRAVDAREITAAATGNALARDLINTPANDLGPAELEAATFALAARHEGSARAITGPQLAEQFPLIAAVGQGSPRSPRLIELRFPRAGAPRIALVGKGVCFDSGGLDIKAAAGMLLMKKDMGGAACALGLAAQLRMLEVPVDLRVLLPAVENSVDGASFRPGDVWRSRKGLTVEIGNTDAEGRLVLADALHYAGEEQPDLIIDFATLTGAARIALGAELPPVYGGDATLVAELVQHGTAQADPLWPMPLWSGYEEELSSRVADLNNAPSGGMAGSVTAALFLRRFVANPTRWLHLDIYGWNPRERPGRPQGAEAQGLRAVCAWLRTRYG
jgi:leucyl aminopeptidase